MLNPYKREIIQNKFNLQVKDTNKLNEIDFTNSKIETKINKNPIINKKIVTNNHDDIIFAGKEMLYKDEPNLEINENVYVCVYLIVNKRKPILLYCMLPNEENDIIDFYTIKYNGGIITNEIIYKLKNIFSVWNKAEFIYNGYLKYNNKNMLWFKCNLNEDYKQNMMMYDNKIQFVMINEIINYGKTFNFKINNDVSKFLLNNPKFCFLYDNKEKLYEVPAVAYVSDTYSKTLLYINLGYRKDYSYNDDKYYIFLDYVSSIEKLNNNEKKGIIKYALFLGNHYIITDSKSDEIIKNYDSLRINTKLYDKVSSKILLNNNKHFFPISYLDLE